MLNVCEVSLWTWNHGVHLMSDALFRLVSTCKQKASTSPTCKSTKTALYNRTLLPRHSQIRCGGVQTSDVCPYCVVTFAGSAANTYYGPLLSDPSKISLETWSHIWQPQAQVKFDTSKPQKCQINHRPSISMYMGAGDPTLGFLRSICWLLQI